MTKQENPSSNNEITDTQGISALPKPWATAVQLIGTFGLAVFLVLYYVFVMQPQERERYDDLRESVESLISVVEKNQTLVTKGQVKNLETLYVMSVANDLGPLIHDAISKEVASQDVNDIVRRTMRRRTELIEGFAKKDGTTISEHIAHRIVDPCGVCKRITLEVEHGSGRLTPQDITRISKDILEEEFSLIRMFK